MRGVYFPWHCCCRALACLLLIPHPRAVTEIVYYTGAVGVVFDKSLFDAKPNAKPSQRFFFGHDNDIECINIHPNRKFVATGQQKATGPHTVPYVCIWDLNTCNQLQKLDHGSNERA